MVGEPQVVAAFPQQNRAFRPSLLAEQPFYQQSKAARAAPPVTVTEGAQFVLVGWRREIFSGIENGSAAGSPRSTG